MDTWVSQREEPLPEGTACVPHSLHPMTKSIEKACGVILFLNAQ
jgi:hypothetical protein